MRSPALAIGWEMWGRNRWGIAAFAAGLLVLSFWAIMLPQGADREPVFLLSVVLFALGFLYLMSIVLNTEFRTRDMMAGYPARLFAMPVRTRALVAWPMIYGIVGLLLMWLAATLLVWLPAGEDPSWWVPPLLAVGLVWFQAICWAVPGSSLAKIIAACIIMPTLKFLLEMVALGVDWFAHTFDVNIPTRPLTIVIFCSSSLPLAYGLAVFGVARDRRGIRFDWKVLGTLKDWIFAFIPKRSSPFGSARRAQLWMELRTKGFILPLFPAGILLFATVAVAPFVAADGLLFVMAVLAALVPFVAFAVGYGFGKTAFWDNELRLSSWQATRPLTSSDLASAKLLAGLFSAGAAWLFLFLAVPLWLALLGEFGEIGRILQPLFRHFSTFEIGALAATGLVGLLVLTWGQLVGGLVLSLTGRTWVVNAVVGLYLAVGTALIVLVRWALSHPADLDSVLTMLSWCALTAVGMKLVAFGYVLQALRRRHLFEWSGLGILVGVWLLGASCLVALPYAILPIAGLFAESGGIINRVPRHLIALAAVLSLPLVRLTAAPLALAWNRHR